MWIQTCIYLYALIIIVRIVYLSVERRAEAG